MPFLESNTQFSQQTVRLSNLFSSLVVRFAPDVRSFPIHPFAMFSLNRITLIGYQTQPVQVRQTPSGTSVTDLNLVVPTQVKTEAGETIQSKSFHTVTLWGPVAEVAGQFVRPGTHMMIGGRLQTDTWEDEKTGEKRSKTKVVGNEMIILDPKSGQLPAPAAESLAGGVNRAEVIGNVTKDPEMRTTTSGQKVLTIGVATNDRWKDRQTGEMKEKSEFHNVVIWGKLAEDVARTVKKGVRVYAAGRVQSRSWETPTGQKRVSTEIVAEQVSALGVKNKIADESLRMDGADAGFRQSSPKDDFAQEPAAASVPNIPSIEYKSEVSVEDLPF